MTNISTQRIITLVDMDCFYCQVEARLNPALKGKPVAVVQYNQWKGGGIIAVNYEAKAKGVTRGMRGAEAQRLCPDINLVSVPVTRGKADLTKYREAGEEVAKIFSLFSDQIQRASIDEAYIDLTKAVKERINNGVQDFDSSQLHSTYIVGHSDLKSNNEKERKAGVNKWIKLMKENTPDSDDFQLTVGGVIVEEMRAQIFEKTGFHCSAGIAHNKVLAKIVAGLHKPNHQTILPQDNVPELYDSLPVYKMRNLGGKFGKQVAEKLSIKFMSELYRFSLKELQQKFDEKSGMWLYNIARGIDLEPVTQRLIPESIGCCKNFRGKEMLRTKQEVKHWVRELADEISERLWKDYEKNKRKAKLLTISIYQETTASRSESLTTYETDGIANLAFDVLMKFNTAPASSDEWEPPIQFLGLSAGKFAKEMVGIGAFFKSQNLQSTTGETTTAKVSSYQPTTSKTEYSDSGEDDSGRSFFLSFLNKHAKESKEEVETPQESTSAAEIERVDEVSVSDVVPTDVTNQPSNAEGSDSPDELIVETQLCEECNKNINILDFFEHLDYHAAVRLQAEINEESKRERMLTKSITTPLKDVQNKRKRIGNNKLVAKKTRDIKSFFQVITK